MGIKETGGAHPSIRILHSASNKPHPPTSLPNSRTRHAISVIDRPQASQGSGLLAGTVRSESVLLRLGSVLGKRVREEETMSLLSGTATSAQRGGEAGPIRPFTASRHQTADDYANVKYYYEDSASYHSDSTDSQEYSDEEVFLQQQSNVPSSGQSDILGSRSPPTGAQPAGVEEGENIEPHSDFMESANKQNSAFA
jgi:hypothetical protein